jgi:peptidoglycan/xylan/chitin deacetylase (PgdA/CDA1 family)
MPSQTLTVITYHRIASDPDNQPFDPGVIDASPEEFEEQIATLGRYFTLVGIEELLAYLDGGPFPDNPAMITFDDGYRDCHDVALPILQRHAAKAVFFISTSYVSERRVFWWDRIGYVIRHARRDRVELSYPDRISLALQTAPEIARRRLLRLVKSHYALDLDRFLDELCHAAGVAWSPEIERALADQLIMDWDQIRALRRAGMEIHSHTRTHRILQTITPAELESELRGARTDLEEQLGERISGVSYPVGHPINEYPEIKAAVAAAGYSVGFSNQTGVTRLGRQLDPLDIRRISIEYGLPIAFFRAVLAFPTLAEIAA